MIFFWQELQKRNLGKFALDKLKISIIIPVYNEENTIVNLQRQFDSLYGKCEIIFVNGGGKDDQMNKYIHNIANESLLSDVYYTCIFKLAGLQAKY